MSLDFNCQGKFHHYLSIQHSTQDKACITTTSKSYSGYSYKFLASLSFDQSKKTACKYNKASG